MCSIKLEKKTFLFIPLNAAVLFKYIWRFSGHLDVRGLKTINERKW